MAFSDDNTQIASNIAGVRERIARAAERAGRAPESITLVAVTKTVEPARVVAAVRAGITDIGENYVQEAQTKIPIVNEECRALQQPLPQWHHIGHLQSNKAKHAVPLFSQLQTIHSSSLAQEVSKQAAKRNLVVPVLLEVNLSSDVHRAGVSPDSLHELVTTVNELPSLQLRGLMGLPPVSDPEEARVHFQRLRRLWETLPDENRHVLSMGMSGDFEQAIEEGTTHVRVGTALFGRRT